MGCCHNKKFDIPRSENLIRFRIKEAIDSGDTKRLGILFSLSLSSNQIDSDYINEEFVKINGKNLNPLAYSIHIGSGPMYLKLLELGASHSRMNHLLENQGIKAINIISSKNHINLLRVYFPTYQKLTPSQSPYIFENPIHTACRMNSIGVLYYFFNYFKPNEAPPEFSFSTCNDLGENSALIACRFGHFKVVKLLYEHFHCDFSLLNNFKENALLVSAKGYSKNRSSKYKDVFIYLVETVGLDITYMHIEILLLLESGEIFDYIDSKLKEKSIYLTRQDVFKYSFTLKGISMATSMTGSMNYTYEDPFENNEELDRNLILNDYT